MKLPLSNEIKYFWNMYYGYTPPDNFDIIDAVNYFAEKELLFTSVCIQLDMDNPDKPKWSLSIVKDNNLIYHNFGYPSQGVAYSEGILMIFKTYKNKK